MPFKLSEATVDTLLDKLSSDDAFRKQFEANPRKALAAIGHRAAEIARDGDSGMWACLACKELASKETIAASRDVLREHLLAAQPSAFTISLELAKPTK